MVLNIGVVHGLPGAGDGVQVIGGIEHRRHGPGADLQLLPDRPGQAHLELGLGVKGLGGIGRLADGGPGVVLVDAQGDAPEIVDLAGGPVGEDLPAGIGPGAQLGQIHRPQRGVPAGAAVENGGAQPLDADFGLGQGLEGVGPTGADVVRRGPEDGHRAHENHRGQHQPPGQTASLGGAARPDRVAQQQHQQHAGEQNQPEYRSHIHNDQTDDQKRRAGQGHGHGTALAADGPGCDPGQGQRQQGENGRGVAAGLAQDFDPGVALGVALGDGVEDAAQAFQQGYPEPEH